jgi:hypothetical protein
MKGKGHVITGAETGVMLLQVKDCQALPTTNKLGERNGGGSFFLRASRRNKSYQCPEAL